MKVGKYNYPEDTLDVSKINKKIKEDFKQFCKEKKIIKSRLVEEIYRTILIRFKDGSLDASEGYCTIKILRGTICKSK